jgi:hypothetical protein
VSADVEAAIAAAFRDEWGRVVDAHPRHRRLGRGRGMRAGSLRARLEHGGAMASRAIPVPGSRRPPQPRDRSRAPRPARRRSGRPPCSRRATIRSDDAFHDSGIEDDACG